MRRYVTIAAGALAGVLVVAGVIGIGRMTAGGQDATGYDTIRWLNVEIDAPAEGSPLTVRREVPFSEQNSRYLLRIVLKEPPPPTPGQEASWSEPEVRIDAETGEVLLDTLSVSSPEAVALLRTLRVVTEPPDVWPYAGVSPPVETDALINISYPVPPPASGITIYHERGQCNRPCDPVRVFISNGRSFLRISASTGQVTSWDLVRDEDRAAYERFATEVRLRRPPSNETALPTAAQ